jgi:mRNA-degrading endonuclease RelE of RelBE toxin-antitoxin system
MKVEIRKSFKKDTEKVKDKATLIKIREVITKIKDVNTITELQNVRKLTDMNNYYRIRISKHRIGFRLDDNMIVLLRVLPRKDFYKSFP